MGDPRFEPPPPKVNLNIISQSKVTAWFSQVRLGKLLNLRFLTCLGILFCLRGRDKMIIKYIPSGSAGHTPNETRVKLPKKMVTLTDTLTHF